MREVRCADVTESVARMCREANSQLGEDVFAALQTARHSERSPVGRGVLDQIINNAEIARDEDAPMCQDTGLSVFVVELGQDCRVTGGDLTEAINDGVRRGYEGGFLRKSVVEDPLKRVNTKDNTPAIVHYHIVPGDTVRISLAPKGGGSENMSEVCMLKPSDGPEGVKNFVIERVTKSGGNPCPPIIVGIGIGGNFELCAINAKKALFRELGSHHPDPYYADMERELLERINKTGIGPMGFGGTTTALGVHIATAPCHIASLPVGVNIQCHAARHKVTEL